jgi:hypothetical protein
VTREYRTTIGTYSIARRINGGFSEDDYQPARADAPQCPDGAGWRLVGSAAADGLLFRDWERDVPDNADTEGPRGNR